MIFDHDAWANGLDYSQLPLDISRRLYEAVRNAVIYYAGIHYQQKGHLEFVHSVTGVRTLKDESTRSLHIMNITCAKSGWR